MKEIGKLAIASSFGLVGMVTGISAVCVCANQNKEPTSEAFREAKQYVEVEAHTFNIDGYSFKIAYAYQSTIAEADEFGRYIFLEKQYDEKNWVNYLVCTVTSYKKGTLWSVGIDK